MLASDGRKKACFSCANANKEETFRFSACRNASRHGGRRFPKGKAGIAARKVAFSIGKYVCGGLAVQGAGKQPHDCVCLPISTEAGGKPFGCAKAFDAIRLDGIADDPKTFGRCRRDFSCSDFHSVPAALPAEGWLFFRKAKSLRETAPCWDGDLACKINSLQIRVISG